MTKGLTLTLAIAILLLVGTLMEEGGPVDKFNAASPAGEATVAVAEEDAKPAPVRLAKSHTPAPEQPAGDMWDWFGESDPAPTAAPAAPAPVQRTVTRGSAVEQGAISRDRMNLEE
ncbi:hypothetical protein [Aurantiacibacter rhizosphaerae]|uniref:Uncharacterized protein n=1 Tax=Aurantiacibacter rhizosphaerae TaxID=2691582 RepID=A0A844XGD7_9SPHN|nr:hypothetical protein [Aurantiacibacter rhizosphaerae]MWV28654.1 hypothetical protein [Aurantiacibacter rhizosphaerae]